MTKQELLGHCTGTYGTLPDYPFEEDFVTTALRHSNSRKWSNMWSKAKNGLVQPRKQGRTSPLYLLRKREIS